MLEESRPVVLLDPNIYLMKLDDQEQSLKLYEWWQTDEIEGRLLEAFFKVGGDLVGNINTCCRSPLRCLPDLEEEWSCWW